MPDLSEHVEKSIRERKLLRARGRVLVAVSGGLDSMVLLHLLDDLASRFNWNLCVAHFNHELRGRASDADERFVKKVAAQLNLPIRVGRGAVKSVARRKGISIEMAARELRQKFFAETAGRLNCSAVALAHHADDQVELFLLRLMRGAGSDGLAGMKWSSVSAVDRRIRLVRPLLDVTKEALAGFARDNRIRYREDASNASVDILRNRVRHELLPQLRRRFQPAVNCNIRRVMDLVGADAEVAEKAAQAWLKSKPSERRFAEQPVGLQRRIIKFQLCEQNIDADYELIELLRNSLGQPVTVSPNLRVQCNPAGSVSRAKQASGDFQRACVKVRLNGKKGLLKLDGAEINWRKVMRHGAALGRCVPNREIFDADRVGPHIVLRHWQAGDRFQPIGMGAAVKLQDWFTNRKIAREQRRKLTVATTAAGEIFWVEGERIGERFKLVTETRQRLVWSWKLVKTT